MKRILLCAALCFVFGLSFGQADSGSFLLHKFAQPIGNETYKVTRDASGNRTYHIDFKFTDRSSPVPLTATIVTTDKNKPLALFIKGKTSRFSTINDSVWIKGNNVIISIDSIRHNEVLKPNSFPVAGYSPGTVQMLMLKYWKENGKLPVMPIYPSGNVSIKHDGSDSFQVDGSTVVLDRYVVGGLIWGNEIAWMDGKGNLACLITNDAEGDKVEMVWSAYKDMLPAFLILAATYGMKLFSKAMAAIPNAGKLIAITGGDILDVVGATTMKNMVVVIENGKIREVGKLGEIKIPANATIIDARGKTIMPSLWDMHAHFQQAEWGPAYLAAGVTVVRDCGNEFEYINSIKEAIDNGRGVGPLILKAGIIDGPGENALGIVRATTAAEAIKAVNMYKDNGYAQIKIYSSVKPDIVKAICTEAKRLGLTVTGHIPQGMTTQAGIDSGMNMINHLQFVASMMGRNPDRSVNLNSDSSRAALQFLASRRIVVDPTIGVYEMIFRSTDEDIHKLEPAFNDLPEPLQALFKNMGMDAASARNNKARLQSWIKLVRTLYDSGVPIVAGTDMGFPGLSLFRELELYVQAGMPVLDVIQSATIIPAIAMKMDKDYGSLRSGKFADLLILDADPLQNISNIRKVWKVVKNGRVYDPAALRKMAGFKK